MQLHRLISLREGQRQVVTKQFEKLESGNLSEKDFKKLLRVVSEKAETIKNLSEKIMHHNDLEDIVTETVESEEYSITLGLKIDALTEKMAPEEDRQTAVENENVNHYTDDNAHDPRLEI